MEDDVLRDGEFEVDLGTFAGRPRRQGLLLVLGVMTAISVTGFTVRAWGLRMPHARRPFGASVTRHAPPSDSSLAARAPATTVPATPMTAPPLPGPLPPEPPLTVTEDSDPPVPGEP